MSQRSGDAVSTTDRERQRNKYRAKVARALVEDDDPLAAYHQFIQWTIKNYGDKDPKSGLLELLKDGTNQFKEDPMYKTDLRYLKMWALYAMQLDRAGAIAVFDFLVANDIGTSYSALYEDFASLLEKDGRRQEAEDLYQQGIKRQVRPLERLKTRYKEFQSRGERSPSGSSTATSANSTRPKSLTSQSRSASSSSVVSTAAPSTSSANLVSFNSTPASRYALMLAPPPPGKRPEKLRFNMGLVFTDEGIEYSIQEARARSMGLLGKKWGPPPVSEMRSSASSTLSSSSARVDFNDDGLKSTRNMGMGRRRSMLGGAEPTVTINTKEALADVFGMYNSPDKTTKLTVLGSKHAPLKKVEPVTPVVPSRPAFSRENENTANSKTSSSAFRPFVDENAQPSRTTPATKFMPFKDDQNKTPSTTPRNAFAVKDVSTPALNQWPSENAPRSAIKPLNTASEEKPLETVFSKVFIPAETKPVPLAPLRDVFTDDHGKPMPKLKSNLTHERAKSHHDIPSENKNQPLAFTPFSDENAQTPFRVFSRPPERNEIFSNVFAPKTPTPSVFTPYTDAKPAAFTPFKDAQAPIFTPFVDKELPPAPTIIPQSSALREGSVSAWSESVHDDDYDEHNDDGEDDSQDHDQYDYGDGEHIEQYETPLAPEHLPEEYEEGASYNQDVPLGGRFGQFNVMTPITERTFEFTTSTRGSGTPSNRFGRPIQDGEGSPKSTVFVPLPRNELVAAVSAERLAAELQEDASEDDPEYEEPSIQPLQLSSTNTVPEQGDTELVVIEEKTGSLSLIDTLTLNSKFRPPNPCNPFDPPILSTLLSRIPKDPHFYEFRDRPSNLLDPLQKFSKKSRKTSGSSNNGMTDVFPLTLQGTRFSVSEKLGEGGFGCVFKARDLGARSNDEDEDDEDDFDDDDGASMVALKIVKPRNLWEYHVLRRLHSALPPPLRRSVILPHALYAFSDESFLVLDLCPQGMLLTIVNNAVSAGVSQAGACLDELLVMFFSIELLKLLEGMHSVGIIHGDLKIDNCLLRLEDVPGGAAAWSPQYQPSGAGGWSHKGLKVIDFGRTIDTRLFPHGQQFIAEWATDERDCFEIQQNQPWTYQTDYFGLAGIIYCMLFGKYIQSAAIVQTEGQRYRIGTPFKRYWQQDLWDRLFDVLLNPQSIRPTGELPLCDELSVLRVDMETWLQANCNRTSNTLKGLLKKVEMACYT